MAGFLVALALRKARLTSGRVSATTDRTSRAMVLKWRTRGAQAMSPLTGVRRVFSEAPAHTFLSVLILNDYDHGPARRQRSDRVRPMGGPHRQRRLRATPVVRAQNQN
jgi:hypothetical protein